MDLNNQNLVSILLKNKTYRNDKIKDLKTKKSELNNIDFINTKLNNPKITDTKLESISLTNASISHGHFRQATINDMNCWGNSITSTYFYTSMIKDSVFQQGTVFTGCAFYKMIIDSTNFEWVKFINCHFRSCWFINCCFDIPETSKNSGHYVVNTFSNCDFRGTHFIRTTFVKPEQVSLIDRKYTIFSLSTSEDGIVFRDCDLSGVELGSINKVVDGKKGKDMEPPVIPDVDDDPYYPLRTGWGAYDDYDQWQDVNRNRLPRQQTEKVEKRLWAFRFCSAGV